jgi:CheY-like chemotaxis protein
MGGHIHVQSTVGVGSRFQVDLPLSNAAASAPEAALPGARGRGSETILVVEDEPAVRDFCKRALEAEGYRVIATGPKGAVEEAAALGASLDLLLTDVVMPELDGPTIAAALTARHPACRCYSCRAIRAIGKARSAVPQPREQYWPSRSMRVSWRRQSASALDRRAPRPDGSASHAGGAGQLGARLTELAGARQTVMTCKMSIRTKKTPSSPIISRRPKGCGGRRDSRRHIPRPRGRRAGWRSGPGRMCRAAPGRGTGREPA